MKRVMLCVAAGFLFVGCGFMGHYSGLGDGAPKSAPSESNMKQPAGVIKGAKVVKNESCPKDATQWSLPGDMNGIPFRLIYCVRDGQAVHHQHWIDGVLNAENAMRDGKWHGKSTYWHKSGKKKIEGQHWNGRQHGTWTYWNEDGSLKKVERYHDGALLKERVK
jgi:hypothetical protein